MAPPGCFPVSHPNIPALQRLASGVYSSVPTTSAIALCSEKSLPGRSTSGGSTPERRRDRRLAAIRHIYA